MHNHWQFLQPHADAYHRLVAGGFQPLVAHLLALRGITDPQEAHRFLEPKLTYLRDPEELPGCPEAAERLLRAIQAGKSITVFGDYDVDGTAGTALLCRCIRLLGGRSSWYIPSRVEEGYGLNSAAIESLAAEGTEVLVTVDCGISGINEVRLARSLGMEVIITDHHSLPSDLPPAHAVVHPELESGGEGESPLSGAGVAFKLAWQLCRLASGSHRLPESLRNLLLYATGLAAVGTIADVIPLRAENRVLVHVGLHALAHSPYVGIKTLLEVAGISPIRPRESEKIAYQIAPRLNAAGRLSHAQLAAELLITDCPDQARQIAEQLNDLNRQRQTLEEEILQQCWRMYYEDGWEELPALVLDSDGWHPGVIGIVAGRLAEQVGRPVSLIARGSGERPAIGSARGVAGFDVFEALRACQAVLRSFGGHPGAGGFTLENDAIPAFRENFLEFASRTAPHLPQRSILPIEAEVPLGILTHDVVREIERIGPFGHGNPRPLLAATGVTLLQRPEPCGGRHLRLFLGQGAVRMRAIAFRRIHWLESLEAHSGPIDIAFYPVLDEFNGERRITLQVVDWRPSTKPPTSEI